ncbi:potassium channel family protein [Bacillus infantis]|uniref:Potassium channel family protein n=1 Tax=Bacillus infantis TaxID=324767 RepID=A0A5D4QY41_9BACI|nr:potassium channel family protein [Bacillus infantis]TYS42262.1 potassium channel family protein [Bacillus infantis]
MPHFIYSSFIRLPLAIRILLIALMVILTFGFIISILEPHNFPTVFDGVWWAVITASTVGYGDYVPHTVPGKVTGIILILTGAGFLSTYFVTLAAAAVTRQNDYLEGKVNFKGEQHLIIIGWNERSRELITALAEEHKGVSIALIDETLRSNPSPGVVHFIQGRSNQDQVLLKANIRKANKVIITADQNRDELQADMNSILSLLAVKGLNPGVPCIVEILTSEQVANARRAGADEIIQTNILTSSVMIHSISAQEMVTSFLDLLGHLNGRRLRLMPAKDFEYEVTFTDLSALLLKDGMLLFGIKRGEETFVNPPHPFSIDSDDELIVIA